MKVKDPNLYITGSIVFITAIIAVILDSVTNLNNIQISIVIIMIIILLFHWVYIE